MKKQGIAVIGMVLALLLGGCGRAAQNEPRSYGPYEQVTRLELDIGAADIRIETGAQLSMRTDNPYFTAEEKAGRLVIREKKHIADLESSCVVLTIPEGMPFEEVEVHTGAGALWVEQLSCGELELELGAGLAEIQSLTVHGSADIAGGAGKIVIHQGQLHDLSFDMGVGEGDIVALLSGDSEISAGVGSLYLTIPADVSGYTVDIESGIGRIEVDGSHVGSGIIGSGSHRIELEGGIGNITVDFEP